MNTVQTGLTYLSFGGGVQSTALIACSALGLYGVPKADVAIFADTKGELGRTYKHIDVVRDWSAKHGIPLHITTAGSLEDDTLLGKGASHVSIPGFIKVQKPVPCASCRESWEDAEGEQRWSDANPDCLVCKGKGESYQETRGIQRRQCTYDYKLTPILKKVRELCRLKPGDRAKGVLTVRAMLGISFDEVIRMKSSREEWITNIFPLVDARLTRQDCKRIISEVGLPVPPRSSCYFCPYHRDGYWRWLKMEEPTEFAKAVAFDEKFRHSQPKLVGESYLHDSLKPLAEITFENPQKELEGFGNECEGICGV